MKDPRCLVGFHAWVGKRRQADQQADSLWDEAGEDGYVVWCARCGKDRTERAAWGGMG
jgi:hypothetical protein